MNDPKPHEINPEIIELARSCGFLKQPLNLYLHGDLTWTETLELMIITLLKDYRKQKSILAQSLKETPQVALGLPIEDKLQFAKLMPKHPLP